MWILWKNEKFSFTEKIFREINFFSKTFDFTKFFVERVRARDNFRNFHIMKRDHDKKNFVKSCLY